MYPAPQPMMGQPMMGQPMMGQPMMGQPMTMGQPMMGQPMMMGRPWMPQQAPIPGCPPGLEYLLTLESIWMHQIVDIIEVFVDFEMANKYRITNCYGDQCFFAIEESGVFTRQVCGSSRPFKMNIIDNLGRVVFFIERPTEGWDDQVSVFLYDGTLLGRIKHRCCDCNFDILDPFGTRMFIIKGPWCGWSCCGNVTFDILADHSRNAIAQIRKEFSVQDLFSDADVFGVEFPLDLDVGMKAVFIGAVFLIDFQYFED